MLSVVFDSFLCAGCAFVTFSTKQSAQNAIKAVHQSTTMEVSESKTKSKKTQDYSSFFKKLYSLSFFFELNQLFVEKWHKQTKTKSIANFYRTSPLQKNEATSRRHFVRKKSPIPKFLSWRDLTRILLLQCIFCVDCILVYCSCRYFCALFLYLIFIFMSIYDIPICHITLLTDVDTQKRIFLVSVFFVRLLYLPPAYTFSLKQCFSCYKILVSCVCMQNCSAVQQWLCLRKIKVAIKLCFNFLFI